MLRVARRSLPLAIAAALALAAPAFAVPPPLGGLTLFPGAARCFTASGAGGCSPDAPQVNGQDMVVAGGTLYVSANGALLAYRLGADGSLTPLDCLASTMLAPCASTDGLVVGAEALAVSATTSTLYMAAGSPGYSRVVAFRLASDGRFGPRLGCLSELPATGCTDVKALDQPRDLAIAADGRKLYTASYGPAGGLAAFGIAADGTFPAAPQLPGCIGTNGSQISDCPAGAPAFAAAVVVRGDRLYAAWHGAIQNKSGVVAHQLEADGSIGARTTCIATNSTPDPQCAGTSSSLTYPQELLLAGDGRTLTVGGAGGAVTVLTLDPTGDLGARRSCEAAFATTGCTPHAGLSSIRRFALSPDGSTLYAAVDNGTLWVLDREPATGATTGTASCLGYPAGGCADPTANVEVRSVTVAPDGARVYGSSLLAGLTVFQREVGPTCLPTSTSVVPPARSAALNASCSDANGDPITYELVHGPEHGFATVSATGAVMYHPLPVFAGTDTFTFRATDGSVASSPANVVVGVVALRFESGTPVPPLAPPRSTIDRIVSPIRGSKLTRFTGRATGERLKRVEIAVFRLDHGARAAKSRPKPACRRLRPSGRIGRAVRASAPCIAAGFLAASGTARWTFNLIRRLPKGRYVIVSRAFGAAGVEKSYTAAARNRRVFTVR